MGAASAGISTARVNGSRPSAQLGTWQEQRDGTERTEAAALGEEGGADSGLLVGLEVILAEAEHDRRLADGRLAEEDELDLDGARRRLLRLLLLLLRVGVHGGGGGGGAGGKQET